MWRREVSSSPGRMPPWFHSWCRAAKATSQTEHAITSRIPNRDTSGSALDRARRGRLGCRRDRAPASGLDRRRSGTELACARPSVQDPVGFHRGLPGYRPTPLVEAPELAAELAVGRVLVKDESNRFGLPAFKILGASWAIERALAATAGVTGLVAATDGNHGRAVARLAAQRGLAARIFVPAGVHPAAVAAIAGEGASVTTVPAATTPRWPPRSPRPRAPERCWYRTPPGPATSRSRTGSSTATARCSSRSTSNSAMPRLDLLVVPVGVGSLAQAAVGHYRRPGLHRPPALLSVEPDGAACALASLRQDALVSIATSPTVMAGLCCETAVGRRLALTCATVWTPPSR